MSTIEQRPEAAPTAIPHDYSKRLMVFGGRSSGELAAKGIRHELDLWGHDVPHDWPSWRAQLAHQRPRFC